MKIKRIKFQKAEFLLIGQAIAFEEDFQAFRPSYAHLGTDGILRRYGEEIGKKKI